MQGTLRGAGITTMPKARVKMQGTLRGAGNTTKAKASAMQGTLRGAGNTTKAKASVNKQDLADGLILKQIRPGDNHSFPKIGDLLSVHYKGNLTNGKLFDSAKRVHYKGNLTNGKLFDSAMDNPFTFNNGGGLGRGGQVIKGWDVGLTHMSLGAILFFSLFLSRKCLRVS